MFVMPCQHPLDATIGTTKTGQGKKLTHKSFIYNHQEISKSTLRTLPASKRAARVKFIDWNESPVSRTSATRVVRFGYSDFSGGN